MNLPLPEALKYASKDPQKQAVNNPEYWAFLNGFADRHEQQVQADNHREDPHWIPFDKTAAGIFADYLDDIGHPYAPLVRRAEAYHHTSERVRPYLGEFPSLFHPSFYHPEFRKGADADEYLRNFRVTPVTNPPETKTYGLHPMAYRRRETFTDSHPVVKWQVSIPAAKSTTGKARRVDITAPFSAADYFQFAEGLPEKEKQLLLKASESEKWTKPTQE